MLRITASAERPMPEFPGPFILILNKALIGATPR
jgi:hypothetical protein